MKTRLALLLSLLALTACADNHGSVAIAGICAPPTDATTCSFSSTCGAVYLGMNMMDLGRTNLLWLIVEVDNQLPDNANSSTNRTDTNRAYVREYEIEYAGGVLPKATGPMAGSTMVPASGTTTMSVFPVNEATGAALAALVGANTHLDVVAKVKLKGVFGDNTSFVTGPYDVTVRACRGTGCYIANLPFIPPATCSDPAKFPVFCPAPGQAPASVTCQ
jgi:hypothetical protein